MRYLISGIIATIIGVVLMKTDTLPLIAAFILAAGILISFVGSTRLKKKDK